MFLSELGFYDLREKSLVSHHIYMLQHYETNIRKQITGLLHSYFVNKNLMIL